MFEQSAARATLAKFRMKTICACLALISAFLLPQIAFADIIAPRIKVSEPSVKMETPKTPIGKKAKKIDPKTKEIPFAGLAASSTEEQAKALEALSCRELLDAAKALTSEQMNADALVLLKKALAVDATENEFVDALRQYVPSVLRVPKSNPEENFALIESALENAVSSRPDSWRVKIAVAALYEQLPTSGYMVDGKFVYSFRWRDNMLSAEDRISVRRLQLYFDALPLVQAESERLFEFYSQNPNFSLESDEYFNEDDAQKEWEKLEPIAKEIARYYRDFATMFYRGSFEYWKLQTLTDVSVLPDYVPTDQIRGRNRFSGASVDEEGNPVFFNVPESFERAQNDGERRQALLEAAIKCYPTNETRADIALMRAAEAEELFGVATLSSYRFFFNDDADARQGIWALNTLEDSETIAKLAGGVKRFALPENYDYINLWREAYELQPNDSFAILSVAEEFQNRRQYKKAADVLRLFLKREGVPNHARKQALETLSQIEDPRVAFDQSGDVRGMNVDLVARYRNATQATVSVRRLDVDVALDAVRSEKFWKEDAGNNLVGAVKGFIRDELNPSAKKSKTKSVWNRLFGSKTIVGPEIANYKITLEPDPNHYDKVASIDFPVKEPGAYLVEIEAENGNKDAVVLWLRDVAIVNKPFDNGQRYFILDSETGEPTPNRKVEFFFVLRKWNNGKSIVQTKSLTETTDKNGSVFIDPKKIASEEYSIQVLTVVPSDKKGAAPAAQFGFKDFNGLWSMKPRDDSFANTRAFFISDRPIYRPKQKAEFTFVVGDAKYDAPANSNWSGKEVEYKIISPSGDDLVQKRVQLDEFGAFSATFEIPEDAKLGVYDVQLATNFKDGFPQRFLGNGSFRLEEYRKPEFKVTVDAPKEPVALGEKFKAKVNAAYYFGAPVANAEVSYKVTRTSYRSNFYPSRYWDWFYGNGYWQFTYDCEWYPGWRRWGLPKIPPFYNARPRGVPEIVLEGYDKIGEDGSFEIEIDSSLAKLIYPNDDQQYEISVEVTDRSRRTIVGNGKVIVAQEPFKTYVWFDRGYFRVGDKMDFNFQARRLDSKPVQGTAVVKLYKIAYKPTDGDIAEPIETEVFSQELKTDEEGKGTAQILASEPGQYRASCVVTTENGIVKEGAQLIVVHGASNKAASNSEFRFNALEITPDKPEYAVGDVARIQLSSNNKNALVLWTARPANGVTRGEPQFVKLENGTAFVEVAIESKDQPNIFVQATTVFGGRLFEEQKELAVPPEKRVLDVAVEPVSERVKPGQKAVVKLRLTAPDGKPVVGQTVVAVYDKSLDALSGGSNVQDIREFFWKWRRYANLDSQCNLNESRLDNVFHIVYDNPVGELTRLRSIGLFDEEIAYAVERNVLSNRGMAGGMGGGLRMKSARKAQPSLMAMGKVDGAMGVAEEAVVMETMDMATPVFNAPMPAATPAMEMSTAAASDDSDAIEKEEEETPFVEAVARTNLADLAYWNADLRANDDGIIEIEIDMPENLTTWKIVAWSVGEGLRVGSGEAEVVTSKDLIVRMQKPRFLTQKDEPVFSANVHNYLDSEKKVQVSLEIGDALEFVEGVEPIREVVVPSNGETRVDWNVRAVGVGETLVTMKALTNEESDAIQESIVVKEHGISKQIPFSGVVSAVDKNAKEQGDKRVRESSFALTIPEERRKETTKLTVRFSPTLAGAIFDALPYLTEYPYGCTEQTLNRFLPMVLAQRALQDSGVDLVALKEKRVNLNAQELGDAQTRAEQWNKRKIEPVFDIEQARRITEEGVQKLLSMQIADGGWGWFSGPGEQSDPRLTALVARGLILARDCDQRVDQNAIDRATNWLVNYEREQVVKLIRGKVWTDEQKSEARPGEYRENANSTDAGVYYALMELGVQPSGYDDSFVDYEKAELKVDNQFAVQALMKELIWEARAQLDLQPLSGYAIALTQETNKNADVELRIETILRLLSQYRQVDEENQTAWLDLTSAPNRRFWSWFGGEFETQAYYLRLLQRVNDETLVKLGLADDAPKMVKYLLNNRKNATYWNSTRDTAFCIEAFVEYLSKTNEMAPNAKVEVLLDGEVKKTVEYSPENLFDVDGTLELSADELSSGEHTIALRVDGDCPLYYNAYLEFFTLEDPIAKAGLELKTERRYYKLVERKDANALVEGGRGQAISQRVEQFDRVPLQNGDPITSGDRIEVELIVDSKNDYESILLEDLKPAGFETIEQKSGYNGNALNAYVEYRDDRVCFFCKRLEQGRSTVKYQLRAETPGKFSALPTKIWAMYAPELKGNADEFKTIVNDRD